MRAILSLLLFAFPLHAQAPYLVKDINTTFSGAQKSSKPSQFTSYRDRIYFVATTDDEGTELWSSDETSGGALIVADILPGEASSNPSGLKVINDVLLFQARDVNHGIELWATDGTAAGTRMLIDINPGPNSSQPAMAVVDRNRLLFIADDGTNGRELWVTDGTAAGTRLFRDLEPGTTSSSPRTFAKLGDSFYFIAGAGLWKTDGTELGTVKVATVTARFLIAAESRLFFEGHTPETGWELWVSDGTEAGTHMLPEILPGIQGAFAGSSIPSQLTPFGERVLFIAPDGVHGRELWISDGISSRMIRDFTAGSAGTWDYQGISLVVFGNRAYFTAEDAVYGHELWSTDGTDAGTAIFLDLSPGPQSSYISPIAVAGGKLFFMADDDASYYDRRLWITDGTAAGTRILNAADVKEFEYDYSARVIGENCTSRQGLR